MNHDREDQLNYQANKGKMPQALDLASMIAEQMGESWVPPSWPNEAGDDEDYDMSNITYTDDGWTFTFEDSEVGKLRITVKEEEE